MQKLIFNRQLKKDYERHVFYGFVMALWVLPTVLAKKEDAIGQEDYEGDFTDPKVMEAMMEKFREIAKSMFHNQPQTKKVLQGLFLEMVDYGILKVEV